MRRPVLTIVLIVVAAVLAVNYRSTVFARFAELPDLWGIDELENGPYRWASAASATCTGVTVGVGYPDQEKPGFIPEELDPYYSITWSLDQVLVYDFDTQTLSELPTQLGDIYTFPLGTPANEFHSKTFNFNSPVPAGTALYVKVRYTINGEDGVTVFNDGATGVFDIGDFDHPYWLMRTREDAYSTSTQFFCDAATASSAPSISLLGDVVGLETDGSASYNYTLFLDKPSLNDVYVDLKTPTGLNLPGSYSTKATFNGYSTRGIEFGSGVCLDTGDDCIVPDYSTVKIPAGQTTLTLQMSISGNNATTRDWSDGGRTVQIIRANNAYIGGISEALFALREDDPCDQSEPFQPCLATFSYPGGQTVIPVDPVSFTVDNIIVMESQQNAIFTVNLTFPNPFTMLNIAYATTSSGRNSTPDVDYMTTSGTLTFLENETSKQISVPIPKDTPLEDVESFGLILNKVGTDESDTVEVGALLLNSPDYNDIPQITGQPQDTTIKVDQSTNLSVAATAESGLSYQWYEGLSGDKSNPITNETGSSYTTPVFTTPGLYDFWVNVYNTSGEVFSETATVTVEDYDTPVITVQPQSVTIKVDQSAELSVAATSEVSELTYQWYEGQSGDTSTPIEGAMNATYITPVYPASGLHNFWVRVSNGYFAADSDTATVFVEAYSYILLSENFETDEDQNRIPDGWSLVNRSKDKLMCNKDTDGDGIRDKIFANTGECAFRFKGVATESALLNWSERHFPTDLSGDDAFEINLWARGNNPLASRMKVRVFAIYTDGTRTKINVSLVQSTDYITYTGLEMFAGELTRIKIQLRSRATSGKYYFDDLTLTVYTDFTESAVMTPETEVVPLPDLPDEFRR